MDENVNPDVSGQSHNDRHEENQGGNYGNEGSFQAGVQKQTANNKSGNAKRDSDAITHIHSTVKKGRFYFIQRHR